MDMTTGLQNTSVQTPRQFSRWAVVLGFVTTRWRAVPTRRAHRVTTTEAAMASRPAHEIRRGVRPARASSVRDLHDSAVLQGVFPPRM